MKNNKLFNISIIIACVVAFILGVSLRIYMDTMRNKKAHTIPVTVPASVYQSETDACDNEWDGSHIIKIDGKDVEDPSTIKVKKG